MVSPNGFRVGYVMEKIKQNSFGFVGGNRNIFLNDLIVQEWTYPVKPSNTYRNLKFRSLLSSSLIT